MKNGTTPPRVVGSQSLVTFVDGRDPIKSSVTTNLHGFSVFNGVENPNHRTQIRMHGNATTPASATFYTSKVTYGFLKGYLRHRADPTLSSYHSYNGLINTGIGSARLTDPSLERARNRAIAKLYDRLGSPASVGEDIAEWKQTVLTLSDARDSIASLADSLSRTNLALLQEARRKNWNDFKKLYKSLADLCLLYRFGVKPLISTINDVNEVLTDGPHFGYEKFRVSATEYGDGSFNSYQQSSTPSTLFDYYARTTIRSKYRYLGEIKVQWDTAGNSFLSEVGLGWRDVIPTIYNLIPYSFLVDYVTNLGTIIDSISVPWGDVTWCAGTSRLETIVQTGGKNFRKQPSLTAYDFTPLSTKFPRALVYGTVFARQPIYSLPRPSFQFEWPSARNLENVLALVTSRLPVIRRLTQRALAAPTGNGLILGFNNQVRDRSLRVPYPFHHRL